MVHIVVERIVIIYIIIFRKKYEPRMINSSSVAIAVNEYAFLMMVLRLQSRHLSLLMNLVSTHHFILNKVSIIILLLLCDLENLFAYFAFTETFEKYYHEK